MKPAGPVWLSNGLVQVEFRESSLPIACLTAIRTRRRIERKFDATDAHSQQDGLGHLESDRATGAGNAGARGRSRIPGLDFDPEDQRRVEVLSCKAADGTLSAEERAELEEYVRVNNELMILQSKARLSLQKTRPRARR